MNAVQQPGEPRSAPVTIRAMRVADLDAVVRIELEAYTMPWTESTFRGLLRRRDADLFVAEIEDELVGYLVQWFVGDQGELGNVAVAAASRGRGIGAQLLVAGIERARIRGAAELFLEVRPSNLVAQRLYARFGFRLVGRRRNYYAQPKEDALVMRLRTRRERQEEREWGTERDEERG